MAKRISVLKPRRSRNLYVLLSFSHYNFEVIQDTVINFEKVLLRKEC